MDFSKSEAERDRITVDAANSAAAEDMVDNRPNDSVINAADRNVTALNLDQTDGRAACGWNSTRTTLSRLLARAS